MDSFKVPQTIPQDLLLIQQFIDAALPSNSEHISKTVVEDDISSSCSEDDDTDDSSEEEVAADLTGSVPADGDEDSKPVNNMCVFSFSSAASH
jgi:H/ACA ribonucleoprotein complex non-core subunit NAF1